MPLSSSPGNLLTQVVLTCCYSTLTMTNDGNQKHASESNDLDAATRPDTELQEGLDYYIENGLLVFTAAFLLKRGYCCESGCRHCPYQNQEP